jgi:hypothetical protein
MPHEPLQQRRVEFLLNAVPQSRSTLAILKVDVGSMQREELGRFESLPAPGCEKRRDSYDNVDISTRIQ